MFLLFWLLWGVFAVGGVWRGFLLIFFYDNFGLIKFLLFFFLLVNQLNSPAILTVNLHDDYIILSDLRILYQTFII